MIKFLVVSKWWDRVMGWWLFLRRRPRCATSPFDPPPSNPGEHRRYESRSPD